MRPKALPIPKHPTKTSKRVEADIRMLVHRLDGSVILHFRHRRSKYTWNGKRTLAPASTSYESYLHDVAHWLVATPEERKHPEFGLGPDPYRRSDATPIHRHAKCFAIEADTCDVQMALVLALDFDPRVVMKEVSMAFFSLDDVDRVRKKFPHVLPDEAWAYVRKCVEAYDALHAWAPG